MRGHASGLQMGPCMRHYVALHTTHSWTDLWDDLASRHLDLLQTPTTSTISSSAHSLIPEQVQGFPPWPEFDHLVHRPCLKLKRFHTPFFALAGPRCLTTRLPLPQHKFHCPSTPCRTAAAASHMSACLPHTPARPPFPLALSHYPFTARLQFLELYQKLYEAPDPAPALTMAFETASRVAELELEVRKLSTSLQEYQTESTVLKNQVHAQCGNR